MTELQNKQEIRTTRLEPRGVAFAHYMTAISTPESAEHAVVLTDNNGAVLEWNSAAERLLGYPRQDMVGQSARRVFVDYVELMDMIQGSRACTVTATAQARDGRLLDLRLTVTPIRDVSGAAVAAVLTAHDDSGARLTQGAAGIAHDFNNLLTVMQGCCEMLQRRFSPADDEYQLAADIHAAGARAEALARKLLSLGGKPKLDIKVIDLNAAIRDIEKTLRHSLGKDIALATNLAPSAALIRVDPAALEQILLNLAFNARDAMPCGGKLTITTEFQPLDMDGPSALACNRFGDHVMLAIADTGVGMSNAITARMFEPFFTTKGPKKGTGLGLALVKSMVEQHGGHVRFDSAPGCGSTFRVYFPESPERADWEQQVDAAARPLPRGRETILLAEDDDGVRAFVCTVLRECGYFVHEAIDGDDAVRAFEKYGDTIDLLVSDVMMPGMDGPIVVSKLLRRKPRLKVLYISGYSNDVIARYGLRDVDPSFLLKPFGAHQVARKVRSLLDNMT